MGPLSSARAVAGDTLSASRRLLDSDLFRVGHRSVPRMPQTTPVPLPEVHPEHNGMRRCMDWAKRSASEVDRLARWSSLRRSLVAGGPLSALVYRQVASTSQYRRLASVDRLGTTIGNISGVFTRMLMLVVVGRFKKRLRRRMVTRARIWRKPGPRRGTTRSDKCSRITAN